MDFHNLRKKNNQINEAKDGDGANIVRDRAFKGKPSKTIPHAKPGEPGHNTHASLFKKDGPKPAWMDRAAKMKKEEVEEKKLTPAELKKREEIAKAMERDNPDMPMAKKMAIATATAKKVAEVTISPLQKIRMDKEKADRNKDDKAKSQAKRITDKQYAAYKVKMKEEAEITEAADPQIEKIKQLVRLGLMDKADMSKIVRALTLMKDGKTVPPNERTILFNMLEELIGMITGDSTMFQKARKAVKEAVEDDEPASPDEAGMAISQLKFICYAAEDIMENIQEGSAFPEWFQNKLTSNYESMKDLYAYMEGESDD